MTPIKDNLSAIKVPGDAEMFMTCKAKTGFLEHETRMTSTFCWADKKGENYDQIDIPLGNYRILGWCTKDEITFDCEPYVERLSLETYVNYNTAPFLTKHYFKNADASFRSLLQSKGIHFVNPYGEKEPEDIPDLGAFTQAQRQRWKMWKKAEQNLVKKVIIIEKI